jgi:integrase/recombinase XerC
MQYWNKQYIHPFLNYLKYEKRYSSNTMIAYQTDLESFSLFLKDMYGSPQLQEVSYHYIRSWLASLKEGTTEMNALTAKSINRKISSLKSFFKYHLKTGNIEVNPMAKIISPKVSKRLPVFIREGDIKELEIRLHSSSEDWKSLNAGILIRIFYATGLRLSELINLKEKQVDFSRRQIKVLGKGNKERSIPVSIAVLDEIKSYIELKQKEFASVPEELLITEKGKKLYPKYAYLLVKEYLSTIPTLDKKSPHVLRHTFATHLINNGAEINAVKELLGHSSLAATQVYTHNTIEKLKEVYKKAHPKA